MNCTCILDSCTLNLQEIEKVRNYCMLVCTMYVCDIHLGRLVKVKIKWLIIKHMYYIG